MRAIRDNTSALAALVAPARVCAVVKADAYGHGAVPVARAAVEGGAAWLAVALVEEGVALRDAQIDAPVLLLSEPPTSDALAEAIGRGLTPTLYTSEGVRAASGAARSAGAPVEVHVKVDTGMHRVGCTPDELVAIATEATRDDHLRLSGVWTHLAASEDPALDDATKRQLELFDEVLAALAARGLRPAIVHAANTGGALSHPSSHFDLVRCGLGIYGYHPGVDHPVDIALRPAMSLKAAVSYVRELDAGERLSYGLRYELGERSTVATVPIGYHDGVPRRLFDEGATVLVGGARRPIAGAVTMDQLMVDCGPGAAVKPGDEVVLIGHQGEERVTADEWAGLLGTISYEVLCGIGPRVPRVYT